MQVVLHQLPGDPKGQPYLHLSHIFTIKRKGFRSWKANQEEAIDLEDHRKLTAKCLLGTKDVKQQSANAQELQASSIFKKRVQWLSLKIAGVSRVRQWGNWFKLFKRNNEVPDLTLPWIRQHVYYLKNETIKEFLSYMNQAKFINFTKKTML